MECNSCNYQRSQECVDCGNPKNEQWKRVEIPVKMRNATPNDEPVQQILLRPLPDSGYSQSLDRKPYQPSLSTKPSPHETTGGGTNDTTSTPLKSFCLLQSIILQRRKNRKNKRH